MEGGPDEGQAVTNGKADALPELRLSVSQVRLLTYNPRSVRSIPMKAERRTIHFAGRVQGVGFRATTVYLARDLSLSGTVQNLPDGQVELVVEGPAREIDVLVRRLREQFERLLRTVNQDVSPATGLLGQGIRIVH
jgi:acylphosphatase